VRTAIRKHLRDFVAVIGMVAIAIGVGGYILSHQRLRFPLIEEKPFVLWVEMPNAQGVIPGQGQTVRVAGMKVGDVGEVKLEDGIALVRMDMEKQYDDLVRSDATVLLRPRTGLKDMFLALDPGSEEEPALDEEDRIPVQNSVPDVNPDEVLSALDSDTRSYLKLLIAGAGKGLRGRGLDLREVFRRLGPLHRDLDRLNSMVVKRRRNLARLVHNYGSTVSRLGREDEDLTALVKNASNVFSRLSQEDQRISLAVERLPGALSQTEATLRKVNTLGQVAGPAFEALRPAVRQIDDTNRELKPLAEAGEPALREQIRPFVKTARPFINDLRPAARNLAKASPDLRESFFELNRFFNLAAYNPGGKETISEACEVDGNCTAEEANRDEGLLHWLGWVSHNSNSLFSTGDASGPFRRILLIATCSTYKQLVEQVEEPLRPVVVDLLGIQSLVGATGLCPDDQQPDLGP
jgi:phospholipid/cholesterol/gamma-HCH transport system substrate-binding protein